AGTGLSRRDFVLRSAALAVSVYGGSKLGLGAFEEGVARAAAVPDGRVLVSVFVPGGWDSLSVLAPVGDPRYASYRPTLGLDRAGDPDNPIQGLSLDNYLSPALASASVPVAAVTNPSSYVFYVPGVDTPVAAPMLDAIPELGRIPTGDPTLGQARAVATRVDRLR